jgi:Domain of unknown function (DUF4129)
MWGGGDGGAVGPSSRRRHAIAIGLAVTAVVLVAIVASGPRVPLATEGDDGWDLFIPNMTPPTLPARQVDRSSFTHPVHTPGIGAFALLAQVVLIMMAAALLVVSGRAVARNWRRFRRDPAPPLADLELRAHPHELVDAIDEGLEAMAAGPVDDVVVECWVRLEAAAAGAGVERLPSETPSELAARVLADLDAPPAAIDALLVRYRAARYSHHRLDERDRAVAMDALRDIRDSIVGAPT